MNVEEGKSRPKQARWLEAIIWLLCAPGIIALVIGVPGHYLGTGGHQVANLPGIVWLVSGGLVAMLLCVFVGQYITIAAVTLWIVLLFRRSSGADRSKLKTSAAVMLAVAGYVLSVRIWRQVH